jgi:hypothetical protein
VFRIVCTVQDCSGLSNFAKLRLFKIVEFMSSGLFRIVCTVEFCGKFRDCSGLSNLRCSGLSVDCSGLSPFAVFRDCSGLSVLSVIACGVQYTRLSNFQVSVGLFRIGRILRCL